MIFNLMAVGTELLFRISYILWQTSAIQSFCTTVVLLTFVTNALQNFSPNN